MRSGFERRAMGLLILGATLGLMGCDVEEQPVADPLVTELQGSWTGCQARIPTGVPASAGLPKSASASYTFTNSEFTFDGTTRMEDNCEEGEPVWRVKASGTFALGLPSPKVDGAHFMNLRVDSLTIELLDSPTVEAFNKAGVCGASDWEASTPRTLSPRDCRDSFDSVLVSTGLLPFTIFQIEGEGLFLGEGRDPIDGINPVDRPNHLGSAFLRK